MLMLMLLLNCVAISIINLFIEVHVFLICGESFRHHFKPSNWILSVEVCREIVSVLF